MKGYPCSVTIHFVSQRQKLAFLTQLCDGWGEPVTEFSWQGQRLDFTRHLFMEYVRNGRAWEPPMEDEDA